MLLCAEQAVFDPSLFFPLAVLLPGIEVSGGSCWLDPASVCEVRRLEQAHHRAERGRQET